MGINKKLQTIKQNRFDLADYLIHFTRNSGKGSFAALKDIISSGYINCTWSEKKYGERTIYGNYPAVCFIEY